MQSIDTNIVLRLLLKDVPEQVELINQLIAGSKPSSLRVQDVVFFEVVWVLSRPPYNLSRNIISESLKDVMELPQLACNRKFLGNVLSRYVQTPHASFIDICLAEYAEYENATPLLTFEKRLAKTLPGACLLYGGVIANK